MLQITAQLPLKTKFFSPPPKKPSTREREYLHTSVSHEFSKAFSSKRKRALFQVNFATARDDLLLELKRLNATNIVISSNVETRQDGLPYANRRQPDAPGVAVYFRSFKKEYALLCDKWDRGISRSFRND